MPQNCPGGKKANIKEIRLLITYKKCCKATSEENMKKLIKKIVQNPPQDKEKEEREFIFPFDSARVFGGQMDPKMKDALYELMNLDLELSKDREGGTEDPDWSSRDYYLSESLFNMLCEKEKQNDPNFNLEVFAKDEKKRVKGVLKEVKKIMDKSKYLKNPTRRQALNYIKHLNTVIGGRNRNVIPGLSVPERALISAYKKEDIRRGQDIYNDWLYYVHRPNRTGTENDNHGSFSHKKTSNKVKRIEKIIPHLPLSEQQTANDELITLKTNLTAALKNQSEI
jgi:hypothetical protein